MVSASWARGQVWDLTKPSSLGQGLAILDGIQLQVRGVLLSVEKTSYAYKELLSKRASTAAECEADGSQAGFGAFGWRGVKARDE